jgi:PAS domain S-box-containing protein
MSLSLVEPIHVLVVDDDGALLRTLSDILRVRGYEPHVAKSGREGIAFVEGCETAPAIALVDLKLPDMDGMEVVGKLRSLSDLTEVVVLTGNASIESAVHALRQQSCDYLIKPVAPDRLLATLGRAGERWLRRRAEDRLRRVEERFKLLIEGIGDVLFLLDADLVVEYASPSVERVLGRRPEDVQGRPATELLLPSAAAPERGLREILEGQAPRGAFELRGAHRTGPPKTLEATVGDLRAHPGIRGFVLTARDVTEQREVERQALQAHRLDSIGRLAGGLAHDFNNILGVVLGAAELALTEPEVPPALQHLISDIREAGEKAGRLTRQLLQFARRQPTAPKVFSLRELAADLAPLLRRLIGEDVELVLDLGDDAASVSADPSQIEQVLLNLAVNARDAMPEGGRLAIETRLLELDAEAAARRDGLPAGVYASLVVRDDGGGMTEEIRLRALEPFFSTKDPASGTGLGLSICFGIVRQAGGSLLIESEVGRGTRVEVILPCAAPGAEAEAGAKPGPPPVGTGETILLVEDDGEVRRVVSAMLRRLGYRVIPVAHGGEGMEILRSAGDSVNLVLSDLVMPVMGGREFERAARELRSGTKFVFMSGYQREPADGAAPVVVDLGKPFSTVELARVIRAALTK